MTSTPQQRIAALILTFHAGNRSMAPTAIEAWLNWAEKVAGEDGEDHIPPRFLRQVLEEESDAGR